MSNKNLAKTIIYVHGIGNKPTESVLKCQWDRALFGVDLGERSRMCYWVNREYYPDAVKASCGEADTTHVDDEQAGPDMLRVLAQDEDELVFDEIRALNNSVKSDQPEKRLGEIARRMLDSELSRVTSGRRLAGITAAEVEAKVLPLPGFLRRRITRRITRAFLRDVHDYFYREERRELMRQSVRERIQAGGGPFIVVAHSQGSMIAWDVLRELGNDVEVPLFVTIGSPLGMKEAQDVLKGFTSDGKMRVPKGVARWINVADRFDPVAIDADISNDFVPKKRVENHARFFLNPDSLRHPHSGTGYLSTPEVRGPVRDLVGPSFAQEVSEFVIARDLVSDLENDAREVRHSVLIQLDISELEPMETSASSEPRTIHELAMQLESEIATMQGPDGKAPTKALLEARRIDVLNRFVAAELTRFEIETLRTRHTELQIDHVWKNLPKRAMISASVHTTQCRPAHLSYGASGRDVRWAVLDTGIARAHPHFNDASLVNPAIEAEWDCTATGAPTSGAADGHGHGTHVAAIIAGRHTVTDSRGAQVDMSGMAPEARLHIYKVLDDQGRGRDGSIIKALDHISETNERAGRLVIHGVNLSLGGAFDPTVYGCGYTPLCQELHRLWHQGVVVVLAAGNEGYAILQSSRGVIPANLDLSIGDPANLEDAIAVGSVHRERPHTYGVSYFSSRGPTADGRVKPDLVAPGEKIWSALHAFDSGSDELEDNYVEMSGTSMAAPHVSGMIASFLSLRREFIGHPDRVKQILLGSCTDLGRDRYIQGHGLPNLIKMLALN